MGLDDPSTSLGRCNSIRNAVFKVKDYRDLESWAPTFQLMRDYFSQMGVQVTEIISWNRGATVVLGDRSTDVKQLPGRIAHILCMYAFEDGMSRPLSLESKMDPQETSESEQIGKKGVRVDLRPGMRVMSETFEVIWRLLGELDGVRNPCSRSAG